MRTNTYIIRGITIIFNGVVLEWLEMGAKCIVVLTGVLSSLYVPTRLTRDVAWLF